MDNQKAIRLCLVIGSIFSVLIVSANQVYGIQFDDPIVIKTDATFNITDAQLMKYGDYWYLLFGKENATTNLGSTTDNIAQTHGFYISKFDEDWTEISETLVAGLWGGTPDAYDYNCRMSDFDENGEFYISCFAEFQWNAGGNWQTYHTAKWNSTPSEVNQMASNIEGNTINHTFEYPCISKWAKAYSTGVNIPFTVGRSSSNNMTSWGLPTTFVDLFDPTDVTEYYAWDCQQDSSNVSDSRFRCIFSGDVDVGDNAGKRYLYMNVYDRDLDFEQRITLMDDEELGAITDFNDTENSGSRFDLFYEAGVFDILWLKNDTDFNIRRLAVDDLGNELTREYLQDNTGSTLNLSTNFTDIRSIQLEIPYYGIAHYTLTIVGTSDDYTTNSKVYLYEQNTSEICSCSDWEEDVCVGDSMRIHRTCIPFDCDDEYDFINSTDCYDEYWNVTRYNYTTFCKEQCCYGNEVDLDKDPVIRTSQCSLEFDVPLNTSLYSNNATAILFPTVAYGFGLPIDLRCDNNWRSMICLPRTDCQTEDFTCCIGDINQTINKTYNQISEGSHIHTHFSMHNDQCSWKTLWWWNGWERWQVQGCVYYCYKYACGERRVCVVDDAGNWLSVAQLPNCDLNMTDYNVCQEGCHAETGLCMEDWKETEEGQQATEDISFCAEDDIFGCLMAQATSNFPSYILMMFSIAISTGGGVYASMYTKQWQLGAVASMGLVLMFMSFGSSFMPPFVGILWILGVVILLMKGIFFKGD